MQICSDELGYLFNKDAVIQAIIDKSLPPEFSHIRKLRDVVDLKFGKGWQHSTSFSNDKKLSRESLLSILNNLSVVSGETLTLGSVNLAKLTDDDIAIATNKGWSVV